MSSTHTSLDAAASERKARLAKLASLKRKQPDAEPPNSDPALTQPALTQPANKDGEISNSKPYLSGRNYDAESRGPKLGFENNPSAGINSLENQADAIARSTAEDAAKDEKAAAESGLDLFKLQPKKPNWDLKRDLDDKMKILNVRTQNAIARLVRERIENAKKDASRKGQEASEENAVEAAGIDGNALVEGVHIREKEEQDERMSEAEE